MKEVVATGVKEPLLNNRKKAVIAINCYAVCFFVFTSLIKYTVNEKKVNALDICFMRTFNMFVMSGILGKFFLR